MCLEHRRLRDLAGLDRAGGSPAEDRLRAFAEQLRAHIRFEERVLFPYLERYLPHDALLHMSEKLQAA